jgi:hypothetical protein
VNLEEPPVEVDLLPRHELAHAAQRVRRPGPPLARVDSTQLVLAAIVTADPDAETEPAGGELRDRRELAATVAGWRRASR